MMIDLKMAGATAALSALLFVAPPSEAQVNKKQATQATKLTAVQDDAHSDAQAASPYSCR